MPAKGKLQGGKEKASKSKNSIQPTRAQSKNKTIPRAEEVHDSPAPRKSKSRKAKSNAIDKAVWMDAGCNKGPGATAEFTKSRKRSLSAAKEESRKKKLKADAGDSIPDMAFNDLLSDDSDLGDFGTNEQDDDPNGKVGFQPQGEDKLSEVVSYDSKKVPGSAPLTARIDMVNLPADLEETSSSESEVSSESDVDTTGGGTEDESENEEVINQRFALEQAKVVARAPDQPSTKATQSGAHTVSSKALLPKGTTRDLSHIKSSNTSNSHFPTSFTIHIPSDPSPKPSKRLEAHQKEQPKINKKDNNSPPEPEVRVWSPAATAVIKSDGKIGVLDQPSTLRAVVTRAFKVVTEHCFFNNMYPGYDKPATFMRPLFLKAAAQAGNRKDVSADIKLEAREIFDRFQQDPNFSHTFSRLAMSRFQAFRASSKTVAEDLPLAQFYNLSKLKQYEIERQLSKELENNLFIYGRKRSGEKLKSAPYSHPALQELCRIWGFRIKGAQSVGLMFVKKYCTSLPDDEEHQEPELPIAFVAAAAGALEVTLSRLRSGIKTKSGRFDEDIFSPVYHYHVRYLNNIKEKSPSNFHRIMADLLRYARDAPEEQALDNDFDFEDRDDSDTGMAIEVQGSGESRASQAPADEIDMAEGDAGESVGDLNVVKSA